jgi:glucan-binding YG repeat protein
MPGKRNTATTGETGSAEPSATQWLTNVIKRRTNTNSTLSASQNSSKPEPELKLETYHAYHDLKSEKLQKWLEDRFQGYFFDTLDEDKVKPLV